MMESASKPTRQQKGSKNNQRNCPSKPPRCQFSTRRLVGNVAPVKGMTRPMKPVPVFEQRPNESDEKFLKRVDRMTKECIQEHKFEEKYNVDVVRDSATGQVQVVKRRNDDAGDGKSGRKRWRRGDRAGDDEKEQKDRRIDRNKLKRLKKQQRLEDRKDEFAHLHDEVQFGEVVQRPPSLSGPSRRSHTHSSPGGAKRLLLHNKLASPGGPSLDLQLERQRAIDLYRQMKSTTTNRKQQ